MSTRKAQIAIAGGVVLLHLGALWALQNGLLRRPAALVVPVLLLTQRLEPPHPVANPPVPVMPAALAPKPAKTGAAKAPAQGPTTPVASVAAPQPVSTTDAGAIGGAAAAVTETAPAATVQDGAASPVVAAAAPTGNSNSPTRVQLPSSNADYLHNPKPLYPPVSRRLGEQGTVLVNVLIGVDGSAQGAEIKKSSGFDRLDQSALAMVLKWRYVPGKRAGVPEAMWYTVPIPFVLE